MQNETKRRKEEEKKKEYYTPVMVSQIICALLLFIIYFFFIASSDNVKNEFQSFLGKELFDTADVISTVRQYLSGDGAWAVFGDSVVYTDEEETTLEEKTETTAQNETHEGRADAAGTAELSGTGGDDLTVYEAANNTSFAEIRTTAPAVKPVEGGRYTSYFGYRINPITDEFSFHTGLDIAAAEGSKIRAAYSGIVSKVGEDSRAGKFIFMTHDDGFVTFYCHCCEILAEEGAVIRQGETIARVGSTGWSTGPHLHFEIRKNNMRYNPIFVLENDS